MTASRLLLLLLVLSTAKRGLSFDADSFFSCLSSAVSQAKEDRVAENGVLEKRTFVVPLEADDSNSVEEDVGMMTEKGKRTFPAVTRYVSLTKSKGKASQNQAKNDRRAKFTLSLDVPTNLMNILFHIAKAKNLRAKAITNAQLMAQIGRRK